MASKQLTVRLAGVLVGLALLLFGGYLLYEKVGLALISGETEERVGTVLRAEEPAIFWTAVGSTFLFGLMLVGVGALILWTSAPGRRKR